METDTHRTYQLVNKQSEDCVVKQGRMSTVSLICCGSPVDAHIPRKKEPLCVLSSLCLCLALFRLHIHSHPPSLKAGVTAWLLLLQQIKLQVHFCRQHYWKDREEQIIGTITLSLVIMAYTGCCQWPITRVLRPFLSASLILSHREKKTFSLRAAAILQRTDM